jgi:hypothetical protein
MIPTSIDGTDITGATIDGTDVQEITVDGQTVFTAGTLPVAYSNLVAWYPFDSAFYGGSNADDATALFNAGQSGDSTAYDGTVNGASFQSSGGVTDINAGANSGAFDFNGSSDNISTNFNIGTTTEFTFMCWFKSSATNLQGIFGQLAFGGSGTAEEYGLYISGSGDLTFTMRELNHNPRVDLRTSVQTNTYVHACGRFDNGSMTLFVDGSASNTDTFNSSISPTVDLKIGSDNFDNFAIDGLVDDARLYDVALTNSQINQMYQNTKP